MSRADASAMDTLRVALVSALLLTGCPGGDAPFTHHTDAGDAGDAGDGGDGHVDTDPGDAQSDADGDATDTGTPPVDAGSGARCGVNGRNDCGPFQTCDEARGCLECASDRDCPLSARYCVAGACASCRAVESDAGALVEGCGATTPACWPGDHGCHAACTGPGDCPANAHLCDLATGECRGCNGAADCTKGVCSPVTHACVECVRDGDCGGALPRCDLVTNRCTECSSNDDCGLREPICDPATRRCRVGCTGDAQCPGERCDAQTATCVVAVDGGADAGPD
jgi:hypothetical protein